MDGGETARDCTISHRPRMLLSRLFQHNPWQALRAKLACFHEAEHRGRRKGRLTTKVQNHSHGLFTDESLRYLADWVGAQGGRMQCPRAFTVRLPGYVSRAAIIWVGIHFEAYAVSAVPLIVAIPRVPRSCCCILNIAKPLGLARHDHERRKESVLTISSKLLTAQLIRRIRRQRDITRRLLIRSTEVRIPPDQRRVMDRNVRGRVEQLIVGIERRELQRLRHFSVKHAVGKGYLRFDHVYFGRAAAV